MQIKSLDHIVITTKNIEKCIAFYSGILGLKHLETNHHHSFQFGHQKINVHIQKGEFYPSAQNVQYESQDFCLITDNDIRHFIRNRGMTVCIYCCVTL